MAKSKSYKMKLDKIRVTFPNGVVIEDDVVKETFAKTIIRLGVNNVFNLKIWGNKSRNILLIENRQINDAIYKDSQMELIPGYYLHTYNSTGAKARYIEKIANLLHVDLKVEIIKNHIKTITPTSNLSSKPTPLTNTVAKTKDTIGQVEKADGVWRYNTGEAPKAKRISTIHFIENGDIAPIPFTDSIPNSDVLIIKHEGKMGVYSMTPIGSIQNPFPLQWICTTDDPFPFDEVRVLGMKQNRYGYIAFRKDGKWGIDKAYYSNNDNKIIFINKIECDNDSLEMAIAKLWRDPFNQK